MLFKTCQKWSENEMPKCEIIYARALSGPKAGKIQSRFVEETKGHKEGFIEWQENIKKHNKAVCDGAAIRYGFSRLELKPLLFHSETLKIRVRITIDSLYPVPICG